MEINEIKYVPKIWGEEVWMANNELYCGKKLILKKGKRVSLHKHKNKDETFYIDEGKVLMEVGNETKVMSPGEAVRIKPGTLHRYSGVLGDAVIIEISTHHEDDDTYREEGELSGNVPKEIMEEYE